MRNLAALFVHLLAIAACGKRAAAVDSGSDAATHTPPDAATDVEANSGSSTASATTAVDAGPPRKCEKVLYCSEEANRRSSHIRESCLPNEVAIGYCSMECIGGGSEQRTMCLPRSRVTCAEEPLGGRRIVLDRSCTTVAIPLPCSLDVSRYPIPKEQCEKHCPLGVHHCSIDLTVKPTKLQCSSFCGVGRLAEGFAGREEPRTATAYFAVAAAMESAAVHAFERLAAELDAWDAPPALVGRARAAARDEERHALHMESLARSSIVDAHAGSLPSHVRPLLALAVENAVEGAVRETLGALVMTHQARQAESPEVRAILAEIAADETEHAELSWDVLRWSLSRLCPHEQRSVLEQARAAMAHVDGCVPSLDVTARAVVGLPCPSEIVRMRGVLFWEIERALDALAGS